MSHTVSIEVKFSELTVLKNAFQSMGWNIVENTTMRTYGNSVDASKVYQYVAQNPSKEYNAYDVGIEVNKNGEIKLYTDFYGGSVAKSLGENFSELKKEYAYKVIEDEYLFQGASVSKEVNKDGTWIVTVEQQ
jgi:hypothetical protein